MAIRTGRVPNGAPTVDDKMAALIKGMLERGDKQSDIAACFQINGGRVAEINTGEKFGRVKPAPPAKLPPAGPYPSPFNLWKMGQGLWRVRAALETAGGVIEEATRVVRSAEHRVGK